MRYANNINVHTKNKSNKIGSVPGIRVPSIRQSESDNELTWAGEEAQ